MSICKLPEIKKKGIQNPKTIKNYYLLVHLTYLEPKNNYPNNPTGANTGGNHACAKVKSTWNRCMLYYVIIEEPASSGVT